MRAAILGLLKWQNSVREKSTKGTRKGSRKERLFNIRLEMQSTKQALLLESVLTLHIHAANAQKSAYCSSGQLLQWCGKSRNLGTSRDTVSAHSTDGSYRASGRVVNILKCYVLQCLLHFESSSAVSTVQA